MLVIEAVEELVASSSPRGRGAAAWRERSSLPGRGARMRKRPSSTRSSRRYELIVGAQPPVADAAAAEVAEPLQPHLRELRRGLRRRRRTRSSSSSRPTSSGPISPRSGCWSGCITDVNRRTCASSARTATTVEPAPTRCSCHARGDARGGRRPGDVTLALSPLGLEQVTPSSSLDETSRCAPRRGVPPSRRVPARRRSGNPFFIGQFLGAPPRAGGVSAFDAAGRPPAGGTSTHPRPRASPTTSSTSWRARSRSRRDDAQHALQASPPASATAFDLRTLAVLRPRRSRPRSPSGPAWKKA